MTSPTIITRCRVCGRPLRNSESVKRGIGPVCWKRLKRIEATNQKLDTWHVPMDFPWRPDTILDEEPEELCNLTGDNCTGDPMFCEECPVMVPEMEEPELPTCPSCGKVSPNPRYCTWCGGPIKAKALEVVA